VHLVDVVDRLFFGTILPPALVYCKFARVLEVFLDVQIGVQP
jgi:hypothetical protein